MISVRVRISVSGIGHLHRRIAIIAQNVHVRRLNWRASTDEAASFLAWHRYHLPRFGMLPMYEANVSLIRSGMATAATGRLPRKAAAVTHEPIRNRSIRSQVLWDLCLSLQAGRAVAHRRVDRAEGIVPTNIYAWRFLCSSGLIYTVWVVSSEKCQ
jgi:hypothetical protein